jgi:hypothetical protein
MARWGIGWRVVLLLLSMSWAASAEPGAELEPFQRALEQRATAAGTRAQRIAGLSPGQCSSELKRRKLTLKSFRGSAKGVALPLRLSAEVGGVRYVAPGGKSPYGVLDCRLALALLELSEVLVRHAVVEVRVDNMYRPRAKLPGRRKPSQHSYGLAIDLTRFKLESGAEVVIEHDFGGAIGEPVCGPQATIHGSTEHGTWLRNLVCDIARAGIFHHILTPNHDRAHRDHFHFDITRGARHRSIE